MANHKSAEKRARQSEKKYARNLAARKTVRTFERKLRDSIASQNKDESLELLKKFSSIVGKATQKGIYKTQTMSRKISNLSAKVSALSK